LFADKQWHIPQQGMLSFTTRRAWFAYFPVENVRILL
jgi:hypothetical protein